MNGTLLAEGDRLVTEDQRYSLQTSHNSTYFFSNLAVSDLENIFNRTHTNQTDIEDIGGEDIDIDGESLEEDEPDDENYEEYEYDDSSEEEGRKGLETSKIFSCWIIF